jgi:hypothetical protein
MASGASAPKKAMEMDKENKPRMSGIWILIRLREATAKKVEKAARARDESISDFGERAVLTELARLGFLKRREDKIAHRCNF